MTRFRLQKAHQRAPAPLENQTTIAVADALAAALQPGWQASHFPAGEHRHVIVGKRLKRMGLKPGWPDFIIFNPRIVAHFLELKRGDLGQLSPEQEEFRDWALKGGGRWALCRTTEEAVDQLTKWGAIDGLKVTA